MDHNGVSPLKVDGELVTDSKMKTEALNKQFKSVCTTLQRKKVSKKGFKGFSVDKGFTALQKTLTCYHRGFLRKRFPKGFIFRQHQKVSG